VAVSGIQRQEVQLGTKRLGPHPNLSQRERELSATETENYFLGEMNRMHRKLSLSLVLVLIAVACEFGLPSLAQGETVLPPPKPNLVPVHWPDLTKLEVDVREQLSSLQNSLSATVKNPATSDVTLSQAYGTMGQIYQAYSLVLPARECYLNATRLSPKDFRWIYLLGRLAQQEGRADEAVAHYLVARPLLPEYVALAVNLGNTLLQLNRLDEAKESFSAALRIEPNAAANYGLGQVALSARSYAEAVEYFQKALAQAPGANRIHYSLAMAYRGLRNDEQAKIHLAQQGPVGVRPADPLFDGLQDLIKGERVHLIRGKLALESKRYQEAVAEFRKAVVARPNSLPAHLNLGAALTQTGDLKGAAAEFEASLRLDPTNIIAHYNLAILLANENRHEEAIAHLRSVFEVDPNDVGARFLFAHELLKSGRLEEALSEFSRVVQANPDNEQALVEQVKLLMRKKQYAQALASLEKAHAQFPRKAETVVMLAFLLAASPQTDLRNGTRALELAQLAYKSTGAVEHGALVVMALGELGRCSEARELLLKLITSAESAHQTDLLTKLRASLKQYEAGPPCRPEGEIAQP
jgi:protein O-mannosyl-transferase